MPVGEKTKTYNGIFTLSDTGAVIVNSIVAGGDENKAASELAKEFEIGMDLALRDTHEFIEQLVQYGILVE